MIFTTRIDDVGTVVRRRLIFRLDAMRIDVGLVDDILKGQEFGRSDAMDELALDQSEG